MIGAVTDADGLISLDVVGTRSATDPTLATTDDQWHIGSCAKSITALLYGCLIEAGKAEWGTPLRTIFSDIPGIDSAWEKITIDDLLRGRAGVRPNPKGMWDLHRNADPITEQRTDAAGGVLRSEPNLSLIHISEPTRPY